MILNMTIETVKVGFITLLGKVRSEPNVKKQKRDHHKRIRGTISDHRLGEVIYHLSGADEKLREMRRWNGETYTIVRCPHCRCKIVVREGHI